MSQTELPPVNPFRRTQRVLGWVNLWLAIGAVVSIVLLILVSSRPRGAVLNGLQIALIISSILLGIFALAFPIGYFIARGEARRVQELIDGFAQGHFLVKWSYTPELWKRYREVEGKESASTFRQLVWGILIGWVIVVLIFCGISYASRHNPKSHDQMSLPVTLWIVAGITVFMGILILVSWIVQRQRLNRSSKTPVDSIVSKRGIYVDRQFVIWGTANRKLEKLEVVQKDDLTFVEISIHMGNNTVQSRVPVPPGSEALAKKVVKVILEDPTAGQGGGAGILQDIAIGLQSLR